MKIYTKTGDSGSTSLLGTSSILKCDERVEAYGSVDELNSFLGLLVCDLSAVKSEKLKNTKNFLIQIQNRLFVIGSHLACTDKEFEKSLPPFKDKWIEEIEKFIDEHVDEIPKQKEFILPGGDRPAALCHLCRTVCRRAERQVVRLHQREKVNESIIVFLNRLSDFLHTTARFINYQSGYKDVAWVKE